MSKNQKQNNSYSNSNSKNNQKQNNSYSNSNSQNNSYDD